jgi:translation initiation factor 1
VIPANLFCVSENYSIVNKKIRNDRNGFVFSTDPNFNFQEDETPITETLPSQQQKLKIKLETKHRGGKAVTLIQGFIGKEEDLQTLGKALKNFCGTGGSVKEGEIIIQGDQREKILQWLVKNDYRNAKKI